MCQFLALALALAMIASACGGDEPEDAVDQPDRGTTDAPSSTTEAPADSTTSTTQAPPSATEPPPASTPESSDAVEGGPSYGVANRALPGELLQSGYDGPFFMVNLVKFRDRAEYADGRETELSGAEANNLYGATGVQVLIKGGMRPAMAGGVVVDPAAPPVPAWDQVAIARYPSYAEFFAMAQDPEFQEGSENKDAGVEISTVIVTRRVEDAPPAAELPPAEDPVVLFELFSHDGVGTAEGPDPLAAYLDDLPRLATGNGGIALGTYEVQGVMVGDGREWDEAHLWWFADRSELEALLADSEFRDLTAARDAALSDHYRLLVDGVLVEPLGREP